MLNQPPQVAVFGRGASVLPLAFVLFVTAVKDAYEDLRRHRSDRQENNRLARVPLEEVAEQLPLPPTRIASLQRLRPPRNIFIMANFATGHRDFVVLAVGQHTKLLLGEDTL